MTPDPKLEHERAVLSGPFETRKPGIDYPCMTGDIEKVAGLTIQESDKAMVRFAKWVPYDQNALSRLTSLPPARDNPLAGTTQPQEPIAP